MRTASQSPDCELAGRELNHAVCSLRSPPSDSTTPWRFHCSLRSQENGPGGSFTTRIRARAALSRRSPEFCLRGCEPRTPTDPAFRRFRGSGLLASLRGRASTGCESVLPCESTGKPTAESHGYTRSRRRVCTLTRPPEVGHPNSPAGVSHQSGRRGSGWPSSCGRRSR